MSNLKHKIDCMANKCSTDNVILNVYDVKEAINNLKHRLRWSIDDYNINKFKNGRSF